MVQVGISKNCYYWKFILFNTNFRFVKLKGSSFIPLPDDLMQKKEIINLKTEMMKRVSCGQYSDTFIIVKINIRMK